MTWRTEHPRDERGLLEMLHALAQGGEMIFRGQPAAYDGRVLSAFDRASEDFGGDYRRLLYLEQHCMALFAANARNHLSHAELVMLDKGPINVMALMQHYSAPTRLVDWSYSPWVAAFFAASGRRESDGVVWGADTRALAQGVGRELGAAMDLWDERMFTLDSPPFITTVHLYQHNTRMVIQQSVFTLAGRLGLDHAERIDHFVGDGGAGKVLLVIDRALKRRLMLYLEGVNLTAETLFPGLDGVGRRLRHFVRYAHLKPGVARAADEWTPPALGPPGLEARARWHEEMARRLRGSTREDPPA